MHLKKIFVILLVFTIGLSAYSYVSQKSTEPEISVDGDEKQTYFYIVDRGEKSVSLSSLQNANNIADFIEYYPASWISQYESVEVHTTSNGRLQKAVSRDANLTAEQKNILGTADMFTDVVVYVRYKSTNSITNEVKDEDMVLKMVVRPEVEAKFPTGKDGLVKYLREKSKDEMANLNSEMGISAIVYFTIDENGNPIDIEISEAATHKGINAFLTDALKNMPKWSPAKDANGGAVMQKFEFVFGFGNEEGGGC